MNRSVPQIAIWTLFATVPAALFITLRVHGTWDRPIVVPTGHFFVVSTVAVASVVLAVIASLAALRLASYRALMLAMAFVGVSAMLVVHGLATPGFLVEGRYFAVTGFAARLTVVLGATLLAASTARPQGRLLDRIVEHRSQVLLAWSLGLAAFAALALRFPESVPPRVVSEQIFLNSTLVITLLMSGIAAYRYLDVYRHSQVEMHGALATSAVLILQAQIGMHYSAVWASSWWLYHLQLLAGFGCALWAILGEYARGENTVSAMHRLTLSDPLQLIEAGYPEVVRSFSTSLEARDRYTHGHGRRVAILSVLIGQQLGLAPQRLRALSHGALLHDVGKIAVPDAILCKPTALTNDEYGVIRHHPAQGEAMLAAAFRGRIELAVIRHHHEWFDGTGYPDRLAGQDIPLEARIAAVADVYDALRSNRSYRPAWLTETAREYIASESGTHFDPRCVDALMQVADRFEREHSWEAERRGEFIIGPEAVALARG
ncbi:MAG: HD-GYP domain-containing protein [Chloroflexi bacterium]|nr:HD-GYP domain-containing protein [Chloroflexota bacterium]